MRYLTTKLKGYNRNDPIFGRHKIRDSCSFIGHKPTSTLTNHNQDIARTSCLDYQFRPTREAQSDKHLNFSAAKYIPDITRN